MKKLLTATLFFILLLTPTAAAPRASDDAPTAADPRAAVCAPSDIAPTTVVTTDTPFVQSATDTATVTCAAVAPLLHPIAETKEDSSTEKSLGQYVLTGSNGIYTLTLHSSGGSTYVASGKISELLSLTSGNVAFDSVTTDERIELTEGSYSFSGSLTSRGAITVSSGADLTLSQLTLTLTDSATVLVKGGELTVEASTVRSDGAAITLNYLPTSRLTLASGEVCSLGTAPALEILTGSATLNGGTLSSNGTAAVSNCSQLTLSGAPKLLSTKYGVITERPILLSDPDGSYSGEKLEVAYRGELTQGTMTELFYGASAFHTELITLYDIEGREFALTYFDGYEGSYEENFLAVYLPYTVRLYSGNGLISTQQRLSGEAVKLPEPEDKLGYVHTGWFLDGEGKHPYPTEEKIYSDTDIYSLYSLKAPEFSVNTFRKTYSQRPYTVTFARLEHPLDSLGGSYELVWYKDGAEVARGRELTVKDVADSGGYSCVITYRYSTDSVTVTADGITVAIEKATVPLPKIEPIYYDGTYKTPKIPESELYTVTLPTEKDAGSYPVIFTLTSPENYRFAESEGDRASIDLVILPASNEWTKLLSVYDTYFGAELEISASSLFGNVRFEFSENGEEWRGELPDSHGEYLVRAVVDGSANYTSLISEPKPLTLLPDTVRTLIVQTQGANTSYRAFELFIPDGVTLRAEYYSGRVDTLDSSAFTIGYQQGDSFRYGDNAVVLSFGGASCSLPVDVQRARYDLSAIFFADCESIYSDSFQSIPRPDVSLVGKDGIPLIFTVTGGGSSVGEYTVTLSFTTDSLNYEKPSDMVAKLTIIPYTAEITWQNTQFVYDGTAKIPTPTYVDVHGVTRSAKVLGAKVFAGGDYTATAYLDDPNYTLLNTEASFSIDRARYDLSSVKWSRDSFVYSGEEYSVTMSGLPDGVTLVGYTDASATLAGSYTARATLAFDEKNYYPPEPPEHTWIIEKASYSLDNISFNSLSVIYDGQAHHPTLLGELPTGADGIPLTYSLSEGATHVSDGAHTVTLTFHTESENYLTPSPLTATVTVLPLGIYVSWSSDTLVYSGSYLCPTPTSELAAISVSGGAVDSGDYVAVAESENTDFCVINAEYSYRIEKAQNAWHKPLYIKDIYSSGALLPTAEPVYGSFSVVYYSDPECTEPIPEPTEAGIYYARAYVPESRNYLALSSHTVSFEIFEVLPISLSARVTANKLVAFETLGAHNLSATVGYNDGTFYEPSPDELKIIYSTEGSLRRGDSFVTLLYGELSFILPVSVDYADYDLSGVIWEDTVTYFDGTPKAPRLSGLPEGITLLGYTKEPTAAGEYTVGASLSYDSENYNAPEIPPCLFTVKRCVVNIPVVPSAEYSKKPYIPATYSPLYTFTELEPHTDAGEYTLKAVLIDKENYVFESGEEECLVSYRILPRTAEVKILDYELFLFESIGSCSYVIADGDVIAGDNLSLAQYLEGEKIYLRSNNPNYSLKVSPGKVVRLGYPSPKLASWLTIGFIFLLAIGLLAFVIYLERERILDTVAIARYKLKLAKDTRSKRSVDNFGEQDTSGVKPKGYDFIDTAPTPEESELFREYTEGADGESDEPYLTVDDPYTDTDEPDIAIDPYTDTDEPHIAIEHYPETNEPYIALERTPDTEKADITADEPSLDKGKTHPSAYKSALGNESSTEAVGDSEGITLTADLSVIEGIDVERAEELITDSLAKDLVKRSREAVYTDGDGKGIINVDTLSAAFAAGDRVDVNILKQKSLIPYDTAYLKVLARGVIDKPLSVYANDFSLAAVKMIALTGGEAVRVVTLKRKDSGKEQ